MRQGEGSPRTHASSALPIQDTGTKPGLGKKKKQPHKENKAFPALLTHSRTLMKPKGSMSKPKSNLNGAILGDTRAVCRDPHHHQLTDATFHRHLPIRPPPCSSLSHPSTPIISHWGWPHPCKPHAGVGPTHSYLTLGYFSPKSEAGPYGNGEPRCVGWVSLLWRTLSVGQGNGRWASWEFVG